MKEMFKIRQKLVSEAKHYASNRVLFSEEIHSLVCRKLILVNLFFSHFSLPRKSCLKLTL